MAEVKVSFDTKVVIALNEVEARKLMGLLFSVVGFDAEPWAGEIYESLSANDLEEISFNSAAFTFGDAE